MNINSSFKTILKSCHAAKPAWATAMATPLPSLQPTRTPVARRVAPADLEAEPRAPGSHGDGGSPGTPFPLVGCCCLLPVGWKRHQIPLGPGKACCLVFLLNTEVSGKISLEKKTKQKEWCSGKMLIPSLSLAV